MDRLLTLDMGNTRSKVAIFANNSLEEFCDFHNEASLHAYLLQKQLPVMACSVVGERVFEGVEVNWLNAQWPLPFVVDVAKPETVGADRLAAVMAGISLFPEKALLIIDMGTCITYEYVSKEARYWGGAISPGVRLRFQSMHDYTAALPQLQASGEIPPKEGKDTESAMQSGVLYGVKAEVMDRIERFQSENPDSMVILTGGDSWLLGNPPKTRIFVEPKLLHYGLYYAYKSR